VQFTDDAPLAEAIPRAITLEVDGSPLRIISAVDLLHAKLRAAADPARRRSKRLQDLADAEALLEAELALGHADTAALHPSGQLDSTNREPEKPRTGRCVY